MKLVKTTILSGIATFIKVATGFVSVKVIAMLIGAPGVATIGTFTNFLAIIMAFGNGAINTGVVKYTAEYADSEEDTKKLFGTAFKISIACSIFFGFILITGASQIANLVFKSTIYWHVILILGLTLIFYSLNSLILSILNGRSQIEKYTIVNTTGTLVGFLLTCLLVYYFKIFGAIYALIISQTVVFFVSLALVYKQPWFRKELFSRGFDKVYAGKLSKYALMALVTTLTVPVAQILLRNIIIQFRGIDDAGIWQGMMRISDGYLMIVNLALATYYLPKLSSIRNNQDLRKEIFNGYKLIVPVIFVITFTIYSLRYFIIDILYTKDFASMETLFFWQLTGDFFRIMAYILAYLMLAKAMVKTYIVSEVLFSLFYVILSYFLTLKFGIRGATMAFAINYITYFLVLILLFRKLLINKQVDLKSL